MQDASVSGLNDTFAQALELLARALTQCGFAARIWKGERIYLYGYGRDIKAHLAANDPRGSLPADGWRLSVKSSWRAVRYNALRCKGVKHLILMDLFAAGLVSVAPPPRWQDVELDAPQSQRPNITRFDAEASARTSAVLPQRRARDPYAALRALHDER